MFRFMHFSVSKSGLILGLCLTLLVPVVCPQWIQGQVNSNQKADDRAARLEKEIQTALDRAENLRDNLDAQLKQAGGVFRLLNNPATWRARLAEIRCTWKLAKTLADVSPKKLDAKTRTKLKKLNVAIEQHEADMQLALQLDAIREQRIAPVNKQFGLLATKQYHLIFAKQGIDIAKGDIAKIAQKIRTSPIREKLIAALDDWTLHTLDTKNQKLRNRLLEIIRRADPDPLRDRFRDPKVWQDRKKLKKLLKKADQAKLSPQMLLQIGVLLQHSGADAKTWLRRAVLQRPTNFALHLQLANVLADTEPAEAIGYYRAALAIRPQSTVTRNNLGRVLQKQGRHNEAATMFKQAIQIDPMLHPAWSNLGSVLQQQGKLQEAIRAYQKAIAIQPANADAYNKLGLALQKQGRLDEAQKMLQRYLEIEPRDAWGWYNLGATLHQKRDAAGATAALAKALKINPKLVAAYSYYGLILRDRGQYSQAEEVLQRAIQIDPKHVPAYHAIGSVYLRMGMIAEAMNAAKAALELAPKDALSHNLLGNVLYYKKDLKGAVAAFKKAVALDPTQARPYYNLGMLMYVQKDAQQAARYFKMALKLQPKMTVALAGMARLLQSKGDVKAAANMYRQAIKSSPKSPQLYVTLGQLLLQQGQFAEAARVAKQVLPMIPEEHPYRKSVHAVLAQGQFYDKLDKKLPKILAGDLKANAKENLGLARLCLRYKKRYHAAVQFFQSAFQAQPSLLKNPTKLYRYGAACAAVLAAGGKGVDGDKVSDKERTELRRKARAWLQADVRALTKRLKDDDKSAEKIGKILAYWRRDGTLTSVRHPVALANLPTAEQKAWRQLWSEVDALHTRLEKR